MDGGGDNLGQSTAPLTWHDFLERMRHPSAADFVKSIKSFIVSFTKEDSDPDKDSASVQEFLTNMEVAFRAHSLWAGCSEEELESAGEGLEKYVMTKLYNRVFASFPEDRKHDEELFDKMALVQQFIRPENLDIKPAFQNETSWLLAQKELQKINMYKAPRDKLVCILNCCKVINNLLFNASLASSENPPGADEFLPVLIYVTIKANPPQLHSNLSYIQRYRRQSHLVSEAAYYFTNILSAESFIWNIDAKSLSMDEEEFQKNMDSAKVILSGLSDDKNDANKQSAHEVIAHAYESRDKKVERMKTKELTSHMSTAQRQSQTSDDSKDLDGHDRSSRVSTSVLETKGATDLLKENQLGRYFLGYPFLYAQAGDLTISDVESLLHSYKELVLKYVALSKGLDIAKPSIHAAKNPLETDSGKELDDASKTVASMETFGEFCKAAENYNAKSLEQVDNSTPYPAAVDSAKIQNITEDNEMST